MSGQINVTANGEKIGVSVAGDDISATVSGGDVSAAVAGGIGPSGPVGPQGPQGPQGEVGPMPYNYQGEWSSGTAYSLHDAVTFEGSLWWLPATGGWTIGGPPPGYNWQLLVSKGGPGEKGDPGDPASATTDASLLVTGTLDDARLSANVVLTDDARLSDSRSPNSHASSHGSAGSDPLSIDASQVSGLFSGSYDDLTNKPTLGTAAAADSADFAAASHSHSLNDLTQSGASAGQVVTWAGASWAAATPSPPTVIDGGVAAVASLLLHCDGTDGGSTFTDSSASGLTVTAHGVTTSATRSKFGATSAYFNNSHLEITDANGAPLESLSFGTGPFGIDLWVYVAGGSTFKNLLELGTSGSYPASRLAIHIYPNGRLTLENTGAGNLPSDPSQFPLNQWVHVAVSRDDSSVLRLFVDGTVVSSAIVTQSFEANIARVGKQWDGQHFSGWIDELRIVKGSAPYTANFFPPVVPYSSSAAGTKILNIRGTAATLANLTLDQGQIAYETDTGLLKAGDGTTVYSSLDYVGASGNYLPLSGGTMTGNIVFDETGGQYIGKGLVDTQRGGSYGLSLVCSVGYQFNWQAGWILATEQNGTTPRPLYLDSVAGTTLRVWDEQDNSGVEVSHTGIKFADETTQTTAGIVTVNSLAGDSAGDLTLSAADVGAAEASHTHSLSGLTRSNASTGQFASWDGTGWVPATVSVSVSAPLTNTGTSTDASIGLSWGDGLGVANGMIFVANVPQSSVTGLVDSLLGKSSIGHGHGSITSAGAIGSTSGRIVVTGTSGVLTTATTISASTQVSGLAAVATSGSASDLGSGTIPVARLPLATTTTAGAIIVGSGLSVASGTVSAAVTSVAGRTGAITLTTSDVSGLGTLATQSGTFSGTSSGNNTGDQTITLTGDVTGSGTGSFSATLAATGVVAGTYTSVTVDAKGRITAGSSPAVAYSSLSGIPSTFSPSAHTHPLSDLSQSGATNGQVATWNGSAWAPATVSGGGSTAWSAITGTPTTLAGYGITDAASSTHTHGNITNAGAIGSTSGQIVVTTTSGVLTTAATISAATQVSGLAAVATSGSATDLSTGTLSASLLPTSGVSAGTYTSVTVDTYGRVTAGSSPAVAYSSLSGVPSTFAPSAHTHPLSDLSQSGASTNQVPQWNGTAWVPATVSGGGTSIVSYATTASFPATGSTSSYYFASDTSRLYQWTGSQYVEIGPPMTGVANAQASINLFLWANFR